jgi:IS30 family transposase
LDWSPEQISRWLKIQHPEDESLRVSHETIYRILSANPCVAEEKKDTLREQVVQIGKSD